jgi:hypothetical protein
MKVRINSCEQQVDAVVLSYEEVVQRADSGRSKTLLHSVTYHVRGGRSGSLTPGQSVTVEDGMVFNAYVTDGA